MRNPKLRAALYAAACLALAGWNATLLNHWWPWPVFSSFALLFLAIALEPDEVARPQWRIQLVDENGLPLSDWHPAKPTGIAPYDDGIQVRLGDCEMVVEREGTLAGFRWQLEGVTFPGVCPLEGQPVAMKSRDLFDGWINLRLHPDQDEMSR